MDRRLLIEAFGWGSLLWLFGYLLGIIFFMFVPAALIGWFITPIGIAATIWVLLNRVRQRAWSLYVAIGAAWTVLAIALDYAFIVLLLHPEDGYYKFDVYLYYALTFILPVAIGWWKSRRGPAQVLHTVE